MLEGGGVFTSLGIRVLGITLHRDSKMTNYTSISNRESDIYIDKKKTSCHLAKF